MFRTKRLMSTINVVLGMLIGSGMMVVFQEDDAKASHSSNKCLSLSHRSYTPTTHTDWVTLPETKARTRCSDCMNWPGTYEHTIRHREEIEWTEQEYEHLTYIGKWIHRWKYCHTHYSLPVTTGRARTSIVRCYRATI